MTLTQLRVLRHWGFTSIRRIIWHNEYTEVQKHADQNGWLPVYYNLSDEPLGDDLTRAAENAEAYHKAFRLGHPISRGRAASRAAISKIRTSA